MSNPRRFPEVAPEAEELILRLVDDGLADLKRRPWLVHVVDWQALSGPDRRLIVEARSAAAAHVKRRSSSRAPTGTSRSTSRTGRGKAGRRRQQVSRQQSYGDRRRAWLRSRFGEYDRAAGWERAAWREAYDRRHFPTVAVVALILAALWGIHHVVDSWVLAGSAAVVLVIAEIAVERAIVGREARRLLALFAEARQQSRYISSALRRQVLARDRFACRFCGRKDDLHVDHIRPHSRGGASELTNLQTLCAHCNISKGARSNRSARRRLARWWRRVLPLR